MKASIFLSSILLSTFPVFIRLMVLRGVEPARLTLFAGFFFQVVSTRMKSPAASLEPRLLGPGMRVRVNKHASPIDRVVRPSTDAAMNP